MNNDANAKQVKMKLLDVGDVIVVIKAFRKDNETSAWTEKGSIFTVVNSIPSGRGQHVDILGEAGIIKWWDDWSNICDYFVMGDGTRIRHA